jgi:VWFA-related protein
VASWTALVLLAVLASQPTDPGPMMPAGSAGMRPAIHEKVRVGRVKWPVRLEPARPDACRGLSPANIEIREDGEARRVTALESRRLPTIHAVLVDVSGSMMPWELWSREAAGAYIQGLPPEDRVMLATFDESLVLRAPLTSDTDALLTSLPRMETRRFTALWDAVIDVLRYLSGRPERKVVVLITDGCDSLSLPDHPFATALALAEASENLTIFPVVLGRITDCGYGLRRFDDLSSAPRTHLETLARRTGGRLYPLPSLGRMEASMREIRRRLDREGFIVYEDIPFGEAAGDGAGHRDARRRRVRIDLHDLPGCRVLSAGPRSRLVGRKDPPAAEAGGAHRVHRGTDGRLAEVEDLVTERGALYDRRQLERHGRYILVEDREPVRETRSVTITVQPFEITRARWMDLDAFLLDGPASEASAPDLVHGRTFLEMRGALAMALLEAPGYDTWAREKIAAERRRHPVEPLAASGGDLSGGPLAGDRLPGVDLDAVGIERAILAHPVRSEEAQTVLAEWLGDLPARRLATRLETYAGNALLGCETGEKEIAACRQQVRTRLLAAWDRLAKWFPPPTRVRIRVPLVPLYDPDRDVFGFYRVLLPQPVEGRRPEDAIPPRPLGFELIRRLAEERSDATGSDTRGEVASFLTALVPGAEVLSIAYRTPTRAERRRLRDALHEMRHPDARRSDLGVQVISLVIAGEGPEDPPRTLTGHAMGAGKKMSRGGEAASLCLGLDRDAPPPISSPWCQDL